MNKYSYFQGGGGVNEPTPKKKKYKSDKAIVVQPRFKEPFYRNYDAYDVPGEHGPGAGWHSMQKYKSISEFLKEKRKKLKDKYKADDSWIEDSGNKIKSRAYLLSKIFKKAIDFPLDDQIKSLPILSDSQSYNTPIEMGPTGDPDFAIYPEKENTGSYEIYPAAVPEGGLLDIPMPNNDFEGKSPNQLNFGRDYTNDKEGFLDNNLLELLEKKYLSSSPTHGTYGLPDGVDLQEDELNYPNNVNPYTGTTDLGIDIYNTFY